jgi:hypothetical protein
MRKINKQVAREKISSFLERNQIVLFFHCNNGIYLNKNKSLLNLIQAEYINQASKASNPLSGGKGRGDVTGVDSTSFTPRSLSSKLRQTPAFKSKTSGWCAHEPDISYEVKPFNKTKTASSFYPPIPLSLKQEGAGGLGPTWFKEGAQGKHDELKILTEGARKELKEKVNISERQGLGLISPDPTNISPLVGSGIVRERLLPLSGFRPLPEKKTIFQSMLVKNRLAEKAFLDINTERKNYSITSLFQGPTLLLGCSDVTMLGKGIDVCEKQKGLLLLGALYQRSIIDHSQVKRLMANSNSDKGYFDLISSMKKPILRPLSLIKNLLSMRHLLVHQTRLISILYARKQQMLSI